MPALQTETAYVVLGDPTAEPIEVVTINPDYLRVEREAPRVGLPADIKAAPLTYMTAVAWAALKRTGGYDGSLRDFVDRDCVLIDWDKGGDEVPPTTAGPATDSP